MNRYCAEFLTGETDVVDDYLEDWDDWGRGNRAKYTDDDHLKWALLNFFGALGSYVAWIDFSVLGDDKKEKHALDLIHWDVGYIVT